MSQAAVSASGGLRARLEGYFEFEKLGTTWKTEIYAGFTTFVTMAYIVLVNPAILHDAGMPLAAVICATCIAAAYGSIAMGLFARYPIALAPGMGLNAYFTYTVVKGIGVPWQTALGAVFVSGIAFLLLTALGVRKLVLATIPKELYAGVSAGVGLFIAFIGLRNSRIIVPHPATVLAIGNLRDPSVAVAFAGLVIIGVLLARRIQAAMLIGVLLTTVIAGFAGLTHWDPQKYSLADLSATAFHLNIGASLKLGLLEIVFVFLFVDFFDNLGTLVTVGKKAGLVTRSVDRIPRLTRIFVADSTATIVSALSGTSTVVSYVESAAGVAAGGRSGVTAIIVGLLFLASLAAVPVLGMIPSAATAPALIVVGSLMMSSLIEVDWQDAAIAIPTFLTMIMIPLTYSIANGLAFGFIAFASIKVLLGRWREAHWLVYLLAGLFLLRFLYLGGLG
ncbi:MAG TPA: NCS2 family permease [Bryobacteraceae bacterium]|jgi:AGZA family xanthine/uracil permease-like MFS transporter|nr:NCS2 family permease [Bryobacteraceae bacterium]